MRDDKKKGGAKKGRPEIRLKIEGDPLAGFAHLISKKPTGSKRIRRSDGRKPKTD